jgi:hypothetical protein
MWDYYTISSSQPLPLSIGNLSSIYQHHVAFRRISGGIERYIFSPSGLSIHSTIRIVDLPSKYDESVPRETLYLEEATEVLCGKVLKWWFESQISKRTEESHEVFRRQWEEGFMHSWEQRRLSEKVDLLA